MEFLKNGKLAPQNFSGQKVSMTKGAVHFKSVFMNNDNLQKLRGIYQNEALDITSETSEPFVLFNKWFNEALASECLEPNAFVLSTIKNNRPRSRVVLLKGVENGDFIFYTNYDSDKGHEIDNTSFVSMNFWWAPLARQVRIEGKIKKVAESVSDDYFKKRPRGSQLGAIASPQSKIVKDRKELEEIFEKVSKKFEHEENIPRPKNWGGFAITPDYMEFWQGRANRLHDRVAFIQVNGEWKTNRLAP